MSTPTISPQELLYEHRLYDSDSFIRHHSIEQSGDEHWLCIGRSQAPPYPQSAEAHFLFDDLPPALLNTVNLFHPQWYSPERPYRPYLPDVRHLLDAIHTQQVVASWVWQEYTVEHAYRFMRGDQVDPALCDLIATDLDILIDILGLIEPPKQQSAIQFNYMFNDVSNRSGDVDCTEGLIKAQLYALELIAAVGYSLSHIDRDYRAVIIRRYGPHIRNWKLPMRRLGSLLDPADPHFATFPIPKLIRDHCPLYLPLDNEYRPSTRPSARVALNSLSPTRYTKQLLRAFPNTRRRAVSLEYPPTFSDHLLDIAISGEAIFGFPDSRSFIPEYRRPLHFNDTLIQHGYIVSSAPVEACLRHYSLTRTQSKQCLAPDILQFALARALPFTLAFPSDSCNKFYPSHSWSINSFPPNLSQPFTPLNGGLPPHIAKSSFISQITAMLRHPTGYTALFQGGLVARIALEFGGQNILNRLLRGPSRTASPMSNYAGLYSDTFLPSHSDLIIGRTTPAMIGADTTSWFPPLDIFNTYLSVPYNWSQPCEDWFQTRISEIYHLDTSDARPLSADEWRDKLKHYVDCRIAASFHPAPDDYELEWIYQRFKGLSSSIQWGPRKLSTIQCDVSRVRYTRLNTVA